MGIQPDISERIWLLHGDRLDQLQVRIRQLIEQLGRPAIHVSSDDPDALQPDSPSLFGADRPLQVIRVTAAGLDWRRLDTPVLLWSPVQLLQKDPIVRQVKSRGGTIEKHSYPPKNQLHAFTRQQLAAAGLDHRLMWAVLDSAGSSHLQIELEVQRLGLDPSMAWRLLGGSRSGRQLIKAWLERDFAQMQQVIASTSERELEATWRHLRRQVSLLWLVDAGLTQHVPQHVLGSLHKQLAQLDSSRYLTASTATLCAAASQHLVAAASIVELEGAA